MTALDDKKAFSTMPKPVHTEIPARRKPTRFEVWAWSPVISFQVGLTAGYLMLIYFGISSIIAAPPAFAMTSPEGYAGWWALALMIGAMISSFGSVFRSKLFERIETIGSTLLSLTVGSYAAIVLFLAYTNFDTTRIAGGAGFMALAVPIIIRTMWLYSQLLRK